MDNKQSTNMVKMHLKGLGKLDFDRSPDPCDMKVGNYWPAQIT